MTHTLRTQSLAAPGKVLWLGEYAVLSGAPALASSVGRHVLTHWTADDPPLQVESNLWQGAWAPGASDAPPQAALVQAALAILFPGEAYPGGTLSIDSGALGEAAKYGLGSSGAVAAGLCALLAPAGWDDDKVTRAALDTHDRFQGGVGSGTDVLTSLHGGLVELRSRHDIRALTPPLKPYLDVALLWTGVSADSRTMVRGWWAWRDRAPRAWQDAQDQLEQLAGAGITALRSADVPRFLDVIAHWTEVMRRVTWDSALPVINEPVSAALRAASHAGYVAKPSGAGGGDVVIAFQGSQGGRTGLAEACAREGVVLLDVDLYAPGVLSQRRAHQSASGGISSTGR